MKNLVENLKEENRMLREQVARLKSPNEFFITETENMPQLFQARINYLQLKNAFYADLLKYALSRLESLGDPGGKITDFLKKGKVVKFTRDNCARATAIYEKAGVQKLLEELRAAGLNELKMADVLTTVSKNIREKDQAGAYSLAREAWKLNPRQYRLKWMLFQAGKAGKYEEAMHLREVMGEDPFTEAELKVLERYRKLNLREMEAARLPLPPGGQGEEAEGQVLTEGEDLASLLGEIRDNLKTLISSRRKEMAYLLDCLDEQKQVIRESADAAFIKAIGKIREISAEEEGGRREEDERAGLLAAIKEGLGAGNVWAEDALGRMAPSELAYHLALLRTLLNNDYGTVIILGSFLADGYAAQLLKAMEGAGKAAPAFLCAASDGLAADEPPAAVEGLPEAVGPRKRKISFKKFPDSRNGESSFYDCRDLFSSIGKDGKALIVLDRLPLTRSDYSILPLLGECINHLPVKAFDMLLHPDHAAEADRLLEKWQAAANMFGLDLSHGEESGCLFLSFHQA